MWPGPVGRAWASSLAHGVELVVAGEDDRAPRWTSCRPRRARLHSRWTKRARMSSQAVALPDLLPEVSGAVAAGVVGVAGAGPSAPVEGQEDGVLPGQPGGHEHLVGIDGEMDQGAPLEGEQRVPGVAVGAVLGDGMLDGLAGELVLELDGGDRQSVDEQDQVQLVGVLGL